MDRCYSIPLCHYALCSKVTRVQLELRSSQKNETGTNVFRRTLYTYCTFCQKLFATAAISHCNILTRDIWTSIRAHSPGSRISIHREFYAEHVGTGLKLKSHSVRKLRRSHTGECGGAISSHTCLIVWYFDTLLCYSNDSFFNSVPPKTLLRWYGLAYAFNISTINTVLSPRGSFSNFKILIGYIIANILPQN